MLPPIGHSLVVAMVVATTIAFAITEEVEDSDENLNQALLLVDILKSAILRRSQRRFAAMPSALADFAGYRPWPPPESPFNGQDQDDAGLRKDNNNTRQMDYEDPYGPAPGGDAPATAEETGEGSTSPQANNENNEESTVATKITETTAAEMKSTKKAQSSSPSDSKAKITKATMMKTIATIKTTKKRSETSKKSGTTLAKRKTNKPGKLFGKSKNTNREHFKTTKASIGNEGGIIKLKYNKNSKAMGAIESKRVDEAEIAEAAIELQREAGDIGGNRCAMRKSHPGPGRTGSSGPVAPGPGPPENVTLTIPCVGLSCNEANATQVTALRFKATTRIYLSRSVRPPIPLPANNAFCFTNPENALCRTKI